MSPIETTMFWATFFLMWAVIGYAFTEHIHARRRIRENRDARAFVEWGRWTMLSVVCQGGDVWATTVKQLHDSRLEDRIWTRPHSVSLWHSSEYRMHEKWQQEAIDMYGTQPPNPVDGSTSE